MVKHSVLTPVLAAVLGVAVVGSGVGYYFTRNSDDTKAKNKNSIQNVADNINNTLDNAKKAVNGELDFSYDATAKITFGQGFTDNGGMALSPISLTTSTKQKGQNTSADFTLAYNDQTLCSLNAVYSRDNKTAYAKVPELSDAYLMCNVDTAKELINNSLSSSGIDLSTLESEASATQFDTEAFEASLDGYGEAFKGALPEAKDGENVKGSIDDIEYEYTTKSYTITGTDASKAVTAVLEKAKTDENLKSYYDETLKSVYETYEVEAGTSGETATYESLIQEMIDSMNSSLSEDDGTTVNFDIYYNSADEFVGFNITPNEETGNIKFITVDSDTVNGVDFNFDISDEEKMTVYGSSKTEDDTTNGTYSLNLTASGLSVEGTYVLTDIKQTESAFSGKIRTDLNVTQSDTSISGWCELNSNSTDDNLDISYELGLNGQSFVTFAVTTTKTEASDITIPSEGTFYDATDETQLDEYLNGCDTAGFMTNIQTVLGDELYGMLSSGMTSSEDDYDYGDDYYYDDTDYDQYLSDYDVDTYSAEEIY